MFSRSNNMAILQVVRLLAKRLHDDKKQLAFDIAAGDGLGEDVRSKTLAQRADCTQGTDGETCLVSLGRLYEQSKVLLDI